MHAVCHTCHTCRYDDWLQHRTTHTTWDTWQHLWLELHLDRCFSAKKTEVFKSASSCVCCRVCQLTFMSQPLSAPFLPAWASHLLEVGQALQATTHALKHCACPCSMGKVEVCFAGAVLHSCTLALRSLATARFDLGCACETATSPPQVKKILECPSEKCTPHPNRSFFLRRFWVNFKSHHAALWGQ